MSANGRPASRPLLILAAVLLAVGLVLLLGWAAPGFNLPFFATPTFTPEPIVPTPTPAAPATTTPASVAGPARPTHTSRPRLSPTPFPTVQATSTAAATATAAPTSAPSSFIDDDLQRFGLCLAREFADAEQAYAAGLRYGALLDWNVRPRTPQLPVPFWQMVRLGESGIRRASWTEIAQTVQANPGATWLVGNEPDVAWQDNVTPQRYAELYHEVYTFIKERDPGAQIAIGGVAQPTPLRRAYLDIVLDTYEETYGAPMPVDIWNVHAFILREEADSWGVGIPPGMAGAEGILYEIDDHDDMAIFARNLRDFRRWMAERGYGEKPLVVSEYGILMPPDYGFPHERVASFMTATFDYFLEATGPHGYAADGDRLVQWWFWYSVYDDVLYPTGNLFDEPAGRLTPLGETWSAYIEARLPPS